MSVMGDAMASTVNTKEFAFCESCKLLISKEKGMWGFWLHENGLPYCSALAAAPATPPPEDDGNNNYDQFPPLDPEFL